MATAILHDGNSCMAGGIQACPARLAREELQRRFAKSGRPISELGTLEVHKPSNPARQTLSTRQRQRDCGRLVWQVLAQQTSSGATRCADAYVDNPNG